MPDIKHSKKKLTHDRIVNAASRAIRRGGYENTGVADVMKEVGLTHGGFYAHFESREAMLAEAADRAGTDTVAALARLAASVPQEKSFQALIGAYLSDKHPVDTGCPVAALGSEMPRQAPEVRRAATRHIKALIDLIAKQSSDRGMPGAHEHALATVATMVGGLMLARAVDDSKLSQSVLESVKKQLLSRQ